MAWLADLVHEFFRQDITDTIASWIIGDPEHTVLFTPLPTHVCFDQQVSFTVFSTVAYNENILIWLIAIIAVIRCHDTALVLLELSTLSFHNRSDRTLLQHLSDFGRINTIDGNKSSFCLIMIELALPLSLRRQRWIGIFILKVMILLDVIE